MKKCLQGIVLIFFAITQGYSQGRTVTGTVVSSDDGETLPGVTVRIKGSTSGAVTGIDGRYSLQVSDGDVLVFSYVGYEAQEIEVGTKSVIDISLMGNVEQLNEVVVTAFGIEQEKRGLGYAVEEVDAGELTRTKQQSVVAALQGKVSGVQITNAGGAPGTSSRIIIRGLTSLNPDADNQPLFVVDGVPIDNSTIESEGTPRGMSNRAADINPNDIESISILKGAAATALYGVRAANGAVIIETKKGEKGSVRVNIKSTIGFEEINKYPDFQETYGQGFSGEYQPTSFWSAWGAPISAVQEIDPTHRYYDNTRNTMSTGVSLDNYISVSGGGENATFFISASHLDQDGVMPNSFWDRTSVKFSGDIELSEQLKFGGSMIYTNSGGNRVPSDRVFERLMYWANTQDVRDFSNPDGTQRTYGNTNPIYDAENSTFEDDVDRIIGNINFSYQPLEWLNVQYRFGSDYYSDRRTEIAPGPVGVPGEAVLNGSDGFIEETRINSRDFNSTLNITLSKDLTNKISGTFRIGNDIFDRSRDEVSLRGEEFVIPRFFSVDNTIAQTNSQSLNERRLVGLYGDLTLSYDNIFYLNVTGRNDWTSTLEADNRSFFYPSVSTSVVFDDWLNLPEQVSFAKVRASYAEVGKDADPYSTSTTYSAVDPINGQVGFTRGDVQGSEELEPERTSSVELGLAAGFFDNRLGIDLTWYQTNSKDQILDAPVSNATGFTTIITNAGEIENRGIELLLKGTPVQTSNFSWDVNINFTRNRNEVIDISNELGTEIFVGSQFGYAGSSVSMNLVEGDAYGNLYGTSYERYYANGTPENLEGLDRDRTMVIGEDGFPERNGEQLILGNSQPDWLAGITNVLTYKNVSLSFLIDIREGIDQYSQFDNFYSAFGKLSYSNNRNDIVVFDGVTSDGIQNLQQVWLGQGVGPDGVNYGAGFYRNHHRGVSENFVQDASFVKLRNVTLSYDLPTKLISSTPFQAISVSAAANNIILSTPWNSYDPEAFSSGAGSNATAFTGLAHPGVRSYFFTLNLTL